MQQHVLQHMCAAPMRHKRRRRSPVGRAARHECALRRRVAGASQARWMRVNTCQSHGWWWPLERYSSEYTTTSNSAHTNKHRFSNTQEQILKQTHTHTITGYIRKHTHKLTHTHTHTHTYAHARENTARSGCCGARGTAAPDLVLDRLQRLRVGLRTRSPAPT